jgi:hypothetical protein
MVYRANGDNQVTIAKKTGFCQSKICRELKKGKDRGAYNPFLLNSQTFIPMKGLQRLTLRKVISAFL